MKLIDKIFGKIYNPKLKLSQNEWREIKESINPYINELEKELEEYRKMIEWMELNSNTSLCDYYNSEENN